MANTEEIKKVDTEISKLLETGIRWEIRIQNFFIHVQLRGVGKT